LTHRVTDSTNRGQLDGVGPVLAIVEFELAWAPNVLTSIDYTYRERHGEALYPVQGPALAKAGDGMRPSDFYRRNVVLSFQKDAIGIRLRDVIGVDNMMWGSDYPYSESMFPQSRKILAERAGRRPGQNRRRQHRPRIQFLTWRGRPSLLEKPTSLRTGKLGLRALSTEAARFQLPGGFSLQRGTSRNPARWRLKQRQSDRED
jgi:hypothetical protein